MSRYIALAHRSDRDAWGLSFPDFPGCISAADSFEDVVEQGAKALRFHGEGLLEDGEAIPEPRSLDALRADPDFGADVAGAIVTLVPLLPPRDQPMRVNVVIDANLLSAIDRTAEELDFNRSEFLAEAARRMIVSADTKRRAVGDAPSEYRPPAGRAAGGGRARPRNAGGAGMSEAAAPAPRKDVGGRMSRERK